MMYVSEDDKHNDEADDNVLLKMQTDNEQRQKKINTNKKTKTKIGEDKKKTLKIMMTSMPIMTDFLFNHCSNNSTHHKSSTQSNLLL